MPHQCQMHRFLFLLIAAMLLAGVVWACNNPWSPSICASGNGTCVWSVSFPGDLDNPPDPQFLQEECQNHGGNGGLLTFFGGTWTYTCCYVDDVLMEPEAPPET